MMLRRIAGIQNIAGGPPHTLGARLTGEDRHYTETSVPSDLRLRDALAVRLPKMGFKQAGLEKR